MDYHLMMMMVIVVMMMLMMIMVVGNHCIAIFSLLIVIFSLHAVLSTSIIFSFFLSSGKHVDLLCVFEQTDMIVLISWHCFWGDRNHNTKRYCNWWWTGIVKIQCLVYFNTLYYFKRISINVAVMSPPQWCAGTSLECQ